MHSVIHHLYLLLAHLGGFGLLILNMVDSSPLFVPLGNDLFFVAMVARCHLLIVYYIFMSATGSVLGCLIVDALSRKSGEKGFERTVSSKRFKFIKRRITKNAGWALAVASLMPPPFPYTGFVAGTAAFQYPRKRLLSVVFCSRLVRFSIEGGLAIVFSRRLLRLMRSPAIFYAATALMLISIVVSVLVVWRWGKGSNSASG